MIRWQYALARYGFCPGWRLVTDRNAIRRGKAVVYVDQWDTETVDAYAGTGIMLL